MKKYSSTGLYLLFLICTSLVLRFYLFPSHLFFGPEQGYIFLTVRDIVDHHKLTLLGPQTDIQGIYHGPLFYYLAAVPFILFRGDPVAVSAFFIFIAGLTVVAVYKLVMQLTNNVLSARVASVFYATSFGLSVYARWLSMPPLSVPFSVLFFYFVSRVLQKDRYALFGAAILFAMLGQVEVINFALFGGISLAILIRFRAMIREIKPVFLLSSFFLALFLSTGNYLLFDLRHGFLLSKRIISYLSAGNQSLPVMLSLGGSFHMFARQAAYTLGSPSAFFGAALLVFVGYILWTVRKKHRFIDLLLFWIFIPPVVLALLRHGALEHMFVGSAAAYVVGMGIVSAYIHSKDPVFGKMFITVILLMNLFAYQIYFPKNKFIFFQAPQPDVRYSDQIEVVRRVYDAADGKPFSIQSYTIPYFWQDAWTYLFDYLGKKEYGYVPTEPTPLLFVIIQKDHANTKYQTEWYNAVESTWGVKGRSMFIGDYIVEEIIAES